MNPLSHHSAQQNEESRAADKGSEDANRQICEFNQCAGSHIGQTNQDRPAKRRSRDEEIILRPHDRSQQVRDNQPYEADEPSKGNCACSEYGRSDDRNHSQLTYIDPCVTSGFLTQSKYV